jgi:hypothetical protein
MMGDSIRVQTGIWVIGFVFEGNAFGGRFEGEYDDKG